MPSEATYARYVGQTNTIVRQFVKETDRDDVPDLSTETRIVAASYWVLSQHDRWGKNYIRVLCCALAQEVDLLKSCELISEVDAVRLLEDLKTKRPRPIGSSENVNPNRREQRTENGTIVKNRALRAVIKIFSDSDDEFDQWIGGLLKIISRIGWRPVETLKMRLVGRILSAPAEKFRRVPSENVGNSKDRKGFGSTDRGLFERLEVRIGERYSEKVLVALQLWIQQSAHWCDVYGGEEPLLAAVLERIRRRCEGAGVVSFSLYDLRHFAIACMKRSGRSRKEIAAAVNHLSDRTAGAHYGKARSGIRRARAMFSIDPARVAKVRESARPYPGEKLFRRGKRRNSKS